MSLFSFISLRSEPRGDEQVSAADDRVWQIASPEGTLAPYDATPTHTAEFVDRAVEGGAFDGALDGIGDSYV